MLHAQPLMSVRSAPFGPIVGYRRANLRYDSVRMRKFSGSLSFPYFFGLQLSGGVIIEDCDDTVPYPDAGEALDEARESSRSTAEIERFIIEKRIHIRQVRVHHREAFRQGPRVGAIFGEDENLLAYSAEPDCLRQRVIYGLLTFLEMPPFYLGEIEEHLLVAAGTNEERAHQESQIRDRQSKVIRIIAIVHVQNVVLQRSEVRSSCNRRT